MKIKTKDKVKVISGKFKGATGTVLKMFNKSDRVLVEGVNIVKKHQKPVSGKEGGIIEVAKPIAVSSVSLICPKCQKPARVGYKLDGAKKRRICKRCNQEF
ncbi:50S ribosomal protein L24 [candidate division WWE3 bacterium CG_4_10_14_0_2_um_filter_42_7]|uniref:Large ribosomal subunit protein uL24 n=2 Tax=Katanobacteria TaxID=422282 RepID=A0A2H0X8W2_UNCKA|nr:MAG: 50S ribosomal protein L24 [candidate division WWE3 bacterium CG08_land_8_20_14_0_20_41_15]PIZ43432.1 MAG: 50S ribosomal protein L24 [candidate division WWE3 bacterium CG_4_10_14_0_2_um_filter_42_7]